MSDRKLRSSLIRLAHAKPELRSTLLPLLKEGARAAWPSKYSEGEEVEAFDGREWRRGEIQSFVGVNKVPRVVATVRLNPEKTKQVSIQVYKEKDIRKVASSLP